jgi:hypothetical protein
MITVYCMKMPSPDRSDILFSVLKKIKRRAGQAPKNKRPAESNYFLIFIFTNKI